MPPKKDDAKVAPESVLKGFDSRETKLLAAGFVAMIGPDKYDYEVMATLTGNTVGSLKKMFPPVKRKAVEAHPTFATFLNAGTGTVATNGEAKKPAPKAAGNKRKATSEPETDAGAKKTQPDGDKADEKAAGKKKAPAKGRGRAKKVKEEVKEEPIPEEDAEGDEDSKEAATAEGEDEV